VDNSKTSDIFNYEFDWYNPDTCDSNCNIKEKCCKKYKEKKEKRCKKCPEKSS
jgi:hypothetical protein